MISSDLCIGCITLQTLFEGIENLFLGARYTVDALVKLGGSIARELLREHTAAKSPNEAELKGKREDKEV